MSWNAPNVSVEELPIIDYSIRYHIRGSGVSGYQYKSVVQSPAEVTGLLLGTEYQVYVASVNAIGTGQYCCVGTPRYVTTYNGKFTMNNYYISIQYQSGLLKCLQLSTVLYFYYSVPSKVTGVTVSKAGTPRHPALRVTWSIPQSDVSISQYQVQYRRNGTTSWSTTGPVSLNTASIYLEDLVADSEYQVQVRAHSAIGNGSWSEVESETTYMSELSVCHVCECV